MRDQKYFEGTENVLRDKMKAKFLRTTYTIIIVVIIIIIIIIIIMTAIELTLGGNMGE
jgi:uncharacterized integral membrane protein